MSDRRRQVEERRWSPGLLLLIAALSAFASIWVASAWIASPPDGTCGSV